MIKTNNHLKMLPPFSLANLRLSTTDPSWRYTPVGGDQHLHHQPPVEEKRRLGIGSITDHIPAKVSICLEGI